MFRNFTTQTLQNAVKILQEAKKYHKAIKNQLFEIAVASLITFQVFSSHISFRFACSPQSDSRCKNERVNYSK